jgi:hypothetical protein
MQAAAGANLARAAVVASESRGTSGANPGACTIRVSTMPTQTDRFEMAKMAVRDATEISNELSYYLELHPRGKNWTARCPFHEEQTRSFTVFTDTQHFHCFGCDKQGDVFTFLMEREGMSFRQAFEMLAEKAGIDLEAALGGLADPE